MLKSKLYKVRTMRKNLRLKTQNLKLGFTLIELLVVISIIGILATLLISRYGMAEKSARDAQRKSDLNQYRTALENFAVKTGGVYPKRPALLGAQASNLLCSDLTSYIAACPGPEDPRYSDTSWDYYRYQSNGTCSAGEACATQYVLWAKVETGTQPNYWVVCSNGMVGEIASVSITQGDCPLGAPTPTPTPTP